MTPRHGALNGDKLISGSSALGNVVLRLFGDACIGAPTNRDKDICFGMIDLDDLEWTRGSEHSWNSSCSFHDVGFAPSFGALLQVDVFETSFNCPTMWRLEPG